MILNAKKHILKGIYILLFINFFHVCLHGQILRRPVEVLESKELSENEFRTIIKLDPSVFTLKLQKVIYNTLSSSRDTLSRYLIEISETNSKKIENVRITYDDILIDTDTFLVDLSLIGCDNIGVVNLSVDLNYVTIQDLKGKALVLNGCEFQDILIQNAQFKGGGFISNNEFNYSYISESEFQGRFTMESNQLGTYCDVSKCKFSGDDSRFTLLDESNVSMGIHDNVFECRTVLFLGNTNYIYPFGSNIYDCNFDGHVIFRTEEGYKNNRDSSLHIFSNLTASKMSFNGYLPYGFQMKNIDVVREIDFSGSYIDEFTHLVIEDVDIDKLNISTRNFQLITADMIYRDYLSNSDSSNIENRIFENLLVQYRNFADSYKMKGLERDYITMDLRHKEMLYNSMHSSFSQRFYFFVSKMWWNFGYSKKLILLWTPLLLILFSICVFVRFEYFLNHIYCIDSIKNKLLENRSPFVKFQMAFAYTAVIFFGFQLSIDKLLFKSMFGSIFIFTMYSIGLICCGYLINYFIST